MRFNKLKLNKKYGRSLCTRPAFPWPSVQGLSPIAILGQHFSNWHQPRTSQQFLILNQQNLILANIETMWNQ